MLKEVDIDEERVLWHELDVLEGEGEYGYTPGAQELGEKFGPGRYILIEAESDYPRVRELEVVAETKYRSAPTAEEVE